MEVIEKNTTILKAYKMRLYPNKEQKSFLDNTMGSARFIYNQMLAERKEVYEKLKDDKEALKKYKYKTEKEYKVEYPFLKDADAIALQQSRNDLNQAYQNFFSSLSGKRKGRKIGYPKFKSKKHNRDSYRTCGPTIRLDLNAKKIKLYKVGWIKYRDDRMPEGQIRNVTVRRTPTGKYFASVLIKEIINTEIHNISSDSKSIGLDYDSKNLFTDNQGNKASYPKFYRKYAAKLRKESRRLARKKLGSSNRNKQRLKVARVHEKITNARSDFQHKLSTNIVKEYDIIGVESLDMGAISRGLKLAKSTLDNSWGSFVSMLEYKCDWQGKHIVFADKYFASTKTCHVCGHKNDTLTLKDREWECPDCHSLHDRDVNAAKNLQAYAVREMSEITAGTAGINALEESVRLAS